MELVLLGTAYLAGLISSQLYLPPLVGYLAAGYVLHAAGVHADATLAHLSGIGIQLLLFTVGLKLKLSSLVKREVLSVGGWHLLIVTAVSVAIFFQFAWAIFRRPGDRRQPGFFQHGVGR